MLSRNGRINICATLEMESYLLPRPHEVAVVDLQESPMVAAVQSKQDAMEMLQAMMETLDRLEKQVPRPPPTPSPAPVNRYYLSQLWSAWRDNFPVAVPAHDKATDLRQKTQWR
jgi:hypothetical protein